MFEVNFNNDKDLEREIKNYNIKKKELNVYKILKVFFATMAVFFILTYDDTIYNMFKNFTVIFPASILVTAFYTVMEVFNDMANDFAKRKSNKSLNDVVNKLSNNKVKTNTNKLSNSVIIKKTNSTRVVTNNDNIKNVSKTKTINKYYLFLDDNSNLQGLLERKQIVRSNDNNEENLNYYILENNDLNELSNKVKKVKKLVRTKEIK